MATWTQGQQKRYRALVAALRQVAEFDEEMRRDVVERMTGERSTTRISRLQMRRLCEEMDRLCREAGAKVRPPRRSRRRTGPATITQDEYIGILAAQLGWEENRLGGFIERTFRGFKGDVAQLTTHEKSLLIVALKNEIADQARGAARAERPEHVPADHFQFVPGGAT